MGRTYRGNNRKAKQKDFDVNFSGAETLGIISFEVGFYSKSLYERTKNSVFIEKSTPLSNVPKEDCINAGKSLLALSTETLQKLYEECKPLIDMTFEEFSNFINEWAKFLKSCNGYDVC